MKSINKYEVIDYLYGYINKNYNGAKLVCEKSLDICDFLINEFSLNNSCSLVCILRIVEYYFNKLNIEFDKYKVFDEIVTFARLNYFTEEFGTLPMKIDDILRQYFNAYGIDVVAKGHYFGNFYKPIKSEIDSDRPLIMNIAFGGYEKHSVTIVGYKIFKYKSLNLKFIELYDGWKRRKSYIDYNVFSHGIFNFGVCSYDTLKIINYY